MGNSQLQKSSFEQNNWRSIEQKQNRKILYNDITMKSVERHEAELDCDEGEAISMCKWRQSLPQDSNIVDLYQFGIKKAGMCNRKSQLYVITQRIHLLSEIGSISRPQAFLILKNVATGLKVLFRKFGNFDPKPNIIGINSQGKAKVWTNQNFAISQPQKNTNIPIPSSQFEIVNNLIRILQQKISDDNSYQIDFPKNLDLNSALGYVNKVFSSLNEFSVDRVYVDRTQFAKRHKQLKQRQFLQQQSRMRTTQAQRRLLQIKLLHQNLRIQQIQLAQKEKQLRIQAEQAQVQRQFQLKRQLQVQRYSQAQKKLEIQRQFQASNNLMTVQSQNNQIISDNSQGKILKGTVSTFRSQAFNSRLLQPSINVNYKLPKQIGIYTHQQPIYQVKNIQVQGRPPLPPRQLPQVLPTVNRNSNTDSSNKNFVNQESIRKEIEMIDSMVLMREDQI